MERLEDIDWSSKSNEEIDSILDARISFYKESIKRNGGKHPKREGFVVERIANMKTLEYADAMAQDGKVKINRYIRRHNLQREKDLRSLQRMILTLTFPPAEYRTDQVKSDSGKVREIAKQKYFPWRILHHAIMAIIGPVLLKSLIYDTFACITGKGLHFGVKRLKMMLRRYPEYKYFVKTDYKKFYQSIPHSLITHELRKKFKDEHLLKLIDITLFSYDSGEEIVKVLDDEIRKKRASNWGIYKPTSQQLCSEFHRPHHKREAPCEMSFEVLR